MTLAELQHALAITHGESYLDEEALIDGDLLVAVCAGIVTVDGKSGIIRLVHHTTQEYLEHIQQELFPTAHVEIARTCLTYISFDEIKMGHSHDSLDFSMQLQTIPFLEYACHFWGLHLRLAANEEAEEEAFQVCRNEQSLLLIGNAIAFWSGGILVNRPIRFNKLHVAASHGLKHMSRLLIERTNIDLNMEDDFGGTLVSLATSKGHLELVIIFLASKTSTSMQVVTPKLEPCCMWHRAVDIPKSSARFWN